ncbi:polysaccharide biosynthesis tyrosine autokinase [Sanguibacter sp. HDW7]|uniref:polysaccharide biosynthesis tyrosine autokinase n=1 Tax=Sanguibacter sp. HDW7 TaxID=2714931 RepID=UPI001F0ED6E1|nr:polysaccharide biosynthesis tyrosine autokinase [Sanguibacter sp. HDW7]
MDFVATLRRRWLVIMIVAVLGAGAGFAMARSTQPLYRSTTSSFVSLTQGTSVAELVQGTTYTQNLVQSFTQLATMPAVLDPVINELGLTTTARALSRSVTAATPLDTMFIEITAVSPDPALAAATADAVAASLARQVKEITPGSADEHIVRLTVVAPAVAASVPFTPNTKRTVALGGAGGLAIGVFVVLALSLLDTRVRRTADLPQRSDAVVLGLIPRDRDARKGRPALVAEPDGHVAESYRRVQTNLQFISAASRVRSLVVSSSVAGEGRTTVAINVAAALAEKGSRVLLVDADLRSPSIALHTGLDPRDGLTTVLVGESDLRDVVRPWGPAGLDIVVAGDLPPNPAQLIDSAAMQSFLDEATALYDAVILDAPPLLPFTDAAVLARHTDGLVMVAGTSRVRRTQVATALSMLDTIDATCLGIVLNGANALESGTQHRAAAARNLRARSSAPAATSTGPRTAAAAPVGQQPLASRTGGYGRRAALPEGRGAADTRSASGQDPRAQRDASPAPTSGPAAPGHGGGTVRQSA